MSKAYDLISESLNEIINDLEENDGKNLKRETLSLEIADKQKIHDKKLSNQNQNEKFFESIINI